MASNRQPNILWICTDQQRYDTLGCYGNEFVRTPNIDRLARRGVVFDHFYVQSAVCAPSRASFLTGRYPRTTRLRQNGQDLPDDSLLMISTRFEPILLAGLAAVAFFGNLHHTSEAAFMAKNSRPRERVHLFADVRHLRRIAYFVVTSAFIVVGTAMVVPLLNVVFHEGQLHANEGEIGVMFAVGEMTLALAILCVPLLALRMLKVDAIVITRLLALPVVLGIGLLPLLLDQGALLLLLVGASYVGRITIFRMSRPLDDAFNMEVLDARERATNTGIEISVASAVSAVAILISSRLMDSGDFATPFVIAAIAYLVSTMVYWRVFRPLEISESGRTALQAEPATAAAVPD